MIDAIIDTAAESTIISDSIFNKLQPKPPTLCQMKFLTAGRGMAMSGLKVGPMQMRIGSTVYNESIHVAPIEDDMLLGFNFLVRQWATLDMKKHLLTIGNSTISLRVGSDGAPPRVCKVTVARRRVIPHNSAIKVKCQMDNTLPDYFIYSKENAKRMIPRTVHRSGNQPDICVVNVTENYMVMKNGEVIGTAVEADIPVDCKREDAEEYTEQAMKVDASPSVPGPFKGDAGSFKVQLDGTRV